MKKRLLILTTLIISVYAMTACGKGKEEAPASPQEVVQEAEAAQEAAEETVKEAAEAAEPENLLEDFVGDMDLSGSWDDEVSKRASMDVVKNEDGSYDITVHWGGSATETAIWTIHGNYSIHTVDDKGNETISGEEKTSGAFMKEGDKLRWQDSKNAEQGLFSKTTE